MQNMFGDIFATEEELLSGQAGGQIQSAWERLPRNCADKLQMPDLPRKKGFPIGLKNQGATCYLNSLFQLLFHTPELRDIILQLPLCKGNSQTASGFVNQGKHNFLLGFQRLFSEMSLCDKRAVGTEYLQKAFGWEKGQHTQQQDLQQAMRIIFDTIQRALYGTNYHEAIRSLFRGTTVRYKTCTVCGQTSERPEEFYDLMLQVKEIKSVEEALQALTTAESMNDQNAIFCDSCQSKQDMWLGTRLQELPGTLVLTLNRFDFDYEKFDRVKLNSYFQYHLELDLSAYVMPSSDPDYNKYQLYGVVIHRGSAHGGHYLCFARDLVHETDWQKGLEEAKAQQARIKEGSSSKDDSKAKDKQNQDKQYDLTPPSNKNLLEGWYEINDNIATAISASKLTSKYQGSDCAYILFYRRKSLQVAQRQAVVPSYFADPIMQENTTIEKQREVYQLQKQHIILNIQGVDHKLKNTMIIEEFKSLFIPEATALVLQSSHNGLPYYPMQICNHPDIIYKPEDSLLSLNVPHESQWKNYILNSPEYEEIRNSIGKDRLPLQLVILVDGESPKRIIAYSDQNLIMLRIKIQKTINVPYQKQIITLVTAYKQQVLTDNTQNDDMLLPKLGIIHGAQLQIKSDANEQDQGLREEGKKDESTMICFVIERDDVIGLKRFYFEKNKTLEDLLQYFLAMESLQDNKKRRFRNLNGNRLYYTEHYTKTLEELDFSEEMVRLSLERGEVPIKGDILIKIKMQSTLYQSQTEGEVPIIEKIFDPNTPIKTVKQWACQAYNLDVGLHKLYLTDWMNEPVRSLTRQQLTVFEANFGREQTICVRDIYSPIGAELVHLQVFSTENGAPDSTQKEGIHLKIEQFKSVKDLKELLISTLELKDIAAERLRLRQIKRDYMFGSIWRDDTKSVKSVTVNSNKVVYQILSQPEHLTEDQIVVTLKARNKEKRIYQGSTEIILQAGKNPSIEDLTQAIKLKVDAQEELLITKYFHYNFEWIQLSRKNIETLAKKKKNNQQKKKGDQQKGNNQDNKKKEENKEATQQKQKKDDNKKTEKQHKNKKESQNHKKEPQKYQQINEKQSELSHNAANKQVNSIEVKENKQKKEKKAGKGQHPKQLLDQCQNLRKAPVLLKDGDILGWGLVADLQGDDLQTEEDLAWRVQLKKETAKFKGKENAGFRLGVEF